MKYKFRHRIWEDEVSTQCAFDVIYTGLVETYNLISLCCLLTAIYKFGYHLAISCYEERFWI